MGLLSEGNPLTWEETHALADHVREHGITQFINLYQKLKSRQGDYLKWGDEVSTFIFYKYLISMRLFHVPAVIAGLFFC